jgi:hypothetical protein
MGYVLPKSMSDLLLDYQESAVRTLSRRIVRRGGTMLGDVVGLGKTLTAVATALMLQAAEDYSTLVLCPKNLQAMWQQHIDEYDINGRVVPYSMAEKVLPELKRFNLVICDESHNLRNNSTIAYEAIKDYIRDNGAKVLLLTATPYNLAFTDVANQIGLYLEADDDLGIVPAEALRKDPALASKVDGKINTLTAFRRSEEPEDWKRLMSDHLVRRTRSFIKRSAKKESVLLPDGTTQEREYLQFANGQRFHFPTRIATPVSHAFTDDDPAALMEQESTLDAIRDLILPRYRLADYDNPKAQHTAADTKNLDDIRSGRGNVSGFVRISLFKRLSSSGHSFILSLQRQRARNELFIHAIDHQLPIPLGSFTDKQIAVSDEDIEGDGDLHGSVATRYETLKRTLPAKTKWVNTTVFKTSLRKDLAKDNDTITTLLDRFGNWDSTRDSKINALVDLLSNDHAGEKVLIFTEYSDTAELHRLRPHRRRHQQRRSGHRRHRQSRRNGPTLLPPVEQAPQPNRGRRRRCRGPDRRPDRHRRPLRRTEPSRQPHHRQLRPALGDHPDHPARRPRGPHRTEVRHRPPLPDHPREDRAADPATATHQGPPRSRRRGLRLRREVLRRGPRDQDPRRLLQGPGHRRRHDDEAEADSVSEAWLVWSTAQDQFPAITEKVLRMQDMVHSTRSQRLNEHGSVTCYVATASGVDAFATSDSLGGTDPHPPRSTARLPRRPRHPHRTAARRPLRTGDDTRPRNPARPRPSPPATSKASASGPGSASAAPPSEPRPQTLSTPCTPNPSPSTPPCA